MKDAASTCTKLRVLELSSEMFKGLVLPLERVASDLLFNLQSLVRKIFKAVRTVYFFRTWYRRKEQHFFFPLGSENCCTEEGRLENVWIHQ